MTRRRNLKAIAEGFGVRVADCAVCEGHDAPLDFLEAWVHGRPSVSLVIGPRGGGKSYLAGLATHLDSIRRQAHGTRILGGSMSQSEQIYVALKSFARVRGGQSFFRSLTKTRAEYLQTGADVSMLAASSTSVRGPHVPTLRLDEVDEIDEEIREASLGMCMAQHGVSASIAMTSTWHRVGGPMDQLIERGRSGEFPVYSFCAFEVLERCPDERSGAHLEKCPECPLQRWCHDVRPGQTPKAKRSNGHYTIDSLIQKARLASRRVFESDYLCLGPKADGLWFPKFDRRTHVHNDLLAEYDPALPVVLAVDSGVHTGAVWFQARPSDTGPVVTVFADYYAEGRTAETNARAILAVGQGRCNGNTLYRYTDPAGGARNPVGPTVLAEYARVGLHLQRWPVVSVAECLNVLEGFVSPASGPPRLLIHSRCASLIRGFMGYRRAKVKGQWRDWPEDPQHPYEDVIDALRGGLYARFPGQKRLKITTNFDEPAAASVVGSQVIA